MSFQRSRFLEHLWVDRSGTTMLPKNISDVSDGAEWSNLFSRYFFFGGGSKSLSKGTNLSVLFAVVCDSGWQIYYVFGRITQPRTIATLIPQSPFDWVVADSKKTCQRKGLNKKACEIRFIKNIGTECAPDGNSSVHHVSKNSCS